MSAVIDRARESQLGTHPRRCAVVECYSRHDEVYLTTVYLLQQLGYEVHVFTVWRNRMKNSFVHAPGLVPRLHTGWSSSQVLQAVHADRFDLVVMNTCEGPAVLDCVRRLLMHTPVLGFIHNGSLVRNLPEYRGLAVHPRLRLMTLARHVAEDFSAVAPASTLTPVFFYDREVPRLPRHRGRRRFCVQGYFDPRRRHYDQLLQALQALHEEGRQDFEVYVMGRSFDAAFRDFATRVRAAGLQDQVRYTWKGIGYRSYYRLLNSVDFVLPLIDPQSHPTYFRSKSTSSIAAAVGFGALPVAHERLAAFYGLEEIALTYTDDLLSTMRRALDLPESELVARRDGLIAARQRLLTDSRRALEQAIAQVNAASSRPGTAPRGSGGDGLAERTLNG